MVTRMLVFYFAMQAMSYFRSRPVTPSTGVDSPPSAGGQQHLSGDLPGNMFAKGSMFDMHVYVSESERFTDFSNQSALFWKLENIEYGDWYGGVNKDGLFYQDGRIELTPVSCLTSEWTWLASLDSRLTTRFSCLRKTKANAKQRKHLLARVLHRGRPIAGPNGQGDLLEAKDLLVLQK